jgi:GNAT superfamily N-acetyltransferase
MRRASPDDAAFVLALFARPHVRGQLHPPSADAYVRSLERKNGENYIVERDGVPFGNLVLEVEPEWLLTIRAIAAWEPKCGAGRFALEFALERGFAELGVHRAFLEILSSNARARRLYERLGFRMEGLYREGYRDESGAFLNLVAYGMLAGDRRGLARAR